MTRGYEKQSALLLETLRVAAAKEVFGNYIQFYQTSIS